MYVPWCLVYKNKKVSGKPPRDYLRDARLQLADELIKNSRITIEEIAEKTGYTDGSHLTKAYHKKFGVNPNVVRKKDVV